MVTASNAFDSSCGIFNIFVHMKKKTRSEVMTLLKLATVSERQAPPIHARNCSQFNKVITSERVLFLQQLCTYKNCTIESTNFRSHTSNFVGLA